ncbi:alpha/beta fold hydrolase [Desulforhopalus singaporensis]|uniref:Esterase/lipase n=1 Tax=Desulforhopalus singaporensis TaxID=91360 RepID=A0A1H0QZK6_9BACT|nr:alpha/beta fold hydrolase [Desulforhopalus singaporensis]SDP22701.1 Esterase/lipase [Desulforhopalus singaporensis]
MNRSAYLTTSLAVKVLSSLSKANIILHGESNIPDGPVIFVINHFTRIETVLVPTVIFNLTDKPVWSLASADLFRGGLEKFFDLVGAVATNAPNRDELIVGTLLSGEANWIIFPEGSMVKTKQIVRSGKYMITDPTGMHAPHTGAAALALRAELYRTCLTRKFGESSHREQVMPAWLEKEGLANISFEETRLVPVNITYYPIRTAENIASNLAAKVVRDIPDSMIEEIMTEGTMLLSGVDLDIRFGKPIGVGEYLEEEWVAEHLSQGGLEGFGVSDALKAKMMNKAQIVMQRYMKEIYAMTTVNHDHLFASVLRMYHFMQISETSFRRRVFYAAAKISRGADGLGQLCLHKSLQENQAHLMTDDRYKKYENFLELCREKKVVEKHGAILVRDRRKLSAPLSVHRGRVDNPIEVMANEVEPLGRLQSFLRSVAWMPEIVLKCALAKMLFRQDGRQYKTDCQEYVSGGAESRQCSGKPFLLPGYRLQTGVLLVHSYLSVPEEVRGLARYLQNRGCWVYAVRLPGHGTTENDLASRKFREWSEAIENGYLLLSTICRRVVVGGVAVGGSLSLDLAARVREVAGVFAICPPYSLGDYSTMFMPGQELWSRVLSRLKREEKEETFIDFPHGDTRVNYPRNPVKGIREVGKFLESIEKSYALIDQPALIIQADNNPVVAPKGSRRLWEQIGSEDKEFCLLSSDRHVLVNEANKEKVFRRIAAFIKEL